jgi:hypothetical protein
LAWGDNLACLSNVRRFSPGNLLNPYTSEPQFNQQLTGRAVARICHGISSPAFPASIWRNDALWKRFSDVDFYALRALATKELVAFKTR